MKIKFLMALISSFVCVEHSFAAEVVFHIPAGTSAFERNWNDAANPVLARVGDTLTIVNDDSVVHQLHALDRPCEHGEPIEPGTSWSTPLIASYDSLTEEPLRDHRVEAQKFWIVVVP